MVQDYHLCYVTVSSVGGDRRRVEVLASAGADVNNTCLVEVVVDLGSQPSWRVGDIGASSRRSTGPVVADVVQPSGPPGMGR